MIKKIAIFSLIIITLGTIRAKHTDYLEISERDYVSSIGIDYDSSTKEYKVFVYILNNTHLGQVNTPSPSNDTMAFVGHGTGESLPKALEKLRDNTNIFFQFSHIRTMIIKDTFFENDNAYLLFHWIRSHPDFYPTFEIYISLDPIEKVFNIENSTSPSPYYTILVYNNLVGFAKNTYFTDYANNILTPDYFVAFPIIELSEDIFYKDDVPFKSVSISGYAFIDKEYKIKCFQKKDVRGLHILDDLYGTTQEFDDIDMQLNSYRKMYTYKKEKFIIRITLNGLIINNPNNYGREEALRFIEDLITNDLKELKNIMDQNNIDIFNITFMNKGNVDFRECPIDPKIRFDN